MSKAPAFASYNRLIQIQVEGKTKLEPLSDSQQSYQVQYSFCGQQYKYSLPNSSNEHFSIATEHKITVDSATIFSYFEQPISIQLGHVRIADSTTTAPPKKGAPATVPEETFTVLDSCILSLARFVVGEMKVSTKKESDKWNCNIKVTIDETLLNTEQSQKLRPFLISISSLKNYHPFSNAKQQTIVKDPFILYEWNGVQHIAEGIPQNGKIRFEKIFYIKEDLESFTNLLENGLEVELHDRDPNTGSYGLIFYGKTDRIVLRDLALGLSKSIKTICSVYQAEKIVEKQTIASQPALKDDKKKPVVAAESTVPNVPYPFVERGKYVENQTCFSIRFVLSDKLPRPQSEKLSCILLLDPFEHFSLLQNIFEYILNFNDSQKEANKAATAGKPTKPPTNATPPPPLDIISCIEINDATRRFLIVEGTADSAMKGFMQEISKMIANYEFADNIPKILFNPNYRYVNKMYSPTSTSSEVAINIRRMELTANLESACSSLHSCLLKKQSSLQKDILKVKEQSDSSPSEQKETGKDKFQELSVSKLQNLIVCIEKLLELTEASSMKMVWNNHLLPSFESILSLNSLLGNAQVNDEPYKNFKKPELNKEQIITNEQISKQLVEKIETENFNAAGPSCEKDLEDFIGKEISFVGIPLFAKPIGSSFFAAKDYNLVNIAEQKEGHRLYWAKIPKLKNTNVLLYCLKPKFGVSYFVKGIVDYAAVAYSKERRFVIKTFEMYQTARHYVEDKLEQQFIPQKKLTNYILKNVKNIDAYVVKNEENPLERTVDLNTLASTDTNRADEPYYMYSGQALRYTDQIMSTLRKQVQQDKDNIYTYSDQFSSLTISPYTEQEVQIKSGFRSDDGKPKRLWASTRNQDWTKLNEHPKRPHSARIEELKEEKYEVKEFTLREYPNCTGFEPSEEFSNAPFVCQNLPPAPPHKNLETDTLLIGNLPTYDTITEIDLKKYFSKFGVVKRIEYNNRRTKAKVIFSTSDCAMKALRRTLNHCFYVKHIQLTMKPYFSDTLLNTFNNRMLSQYIEFEREETIEQLNEAIRQKDLEEFTRKLVVSDSTVHHLTKTDKIRRPNITDRNKTLLYDDSPVKKALTFKPVKPIPLSITAEDEFVDKIEKPLTQTYSIFPNSRFPELVPQSRN